MSSRIREASASTQGALERRDGSSTNINGEVNDVTMTDSTHDLDSEHASEAATMSTPDAPLDHSTRADEKDTVMTVELSPGQGLMVKLKDSNVTFKLDCDDLGYRIFGSGMGNPAPMIVQHPGSFNVFLFKRHYGNTFNFFGLPGEIRNLIYSFIFQKKSGTGDYYPLFFNYKKAQNPIRFFTHLNKDATGRCGLPLASRQTLHETRSFFLESTHFKFNNDRALRTFLKSIGPDARSIWSGPLAITFNKDLGAWQGRFRFKENERWTSFLAECDNLRSIRITIHEESLWENPYRVSKDAHDPIYTLIANGHGLFPHLDTVTIQHKWKKIVYGIPFHRDSLHSLGAADLSFLRSKVDDAELEQHQDRLIKRINDLLGLDRLRLA
ncbi:hypothetical protein IWZ01DRAFT_281766 [Phyllosticta capitalensis]